MPCGGCKNDFLLHRSVDSIFTVPLRSLGSFLCQLGNGILQKPVL